MAQGNVIINSLSTLSAPLFTANQTAGSITLPTPSITPPSGSGAIPIGHGGGISCANLIFVPYGVGSGGTTFTLNIYAWLATLQAISSNNYNPLYVPYLLASVTCTITSSSIVGVAGTAVPATNTFCDTLALAAPTSSTTVEVVSPTSGSLGHIVVPTRGARWITGVIAVGTATSGNTLYCEL